MPLSIVILAAGKGTRMRSARAKVLHPLGGRPLLKHVIDTARSLDPREIYVVVGHGSAAIRQQLAAESVVWVEQVEQQGTGHAVQQAIPLIPTDDDILIVYGDVPLIRSETLQQVVDSLHNVSLCLLTAVLENPDGYGRIVRDSNGELVSIVEQKDASVEQCAIAEINTGILAANATDLGGLLEALDCDNAQGEYYLTDVIASGSGAGLDMSSIVIDDFVEVSGVNDREQLATMERVYQRARASELMVRGVTLADPARIDIRGETSVGRDSTIDVNCVFIGKNTIGENVTIGPNCAISNSHIGDHAVIEANCVIENARIEQHCAIGPFARLRPGAVVADQVRIGNFVEIKNSHIGVGSKVNHLAYVGDSEVGENANIGAGTITANYDGANKHSTHIENDVSIGANSVLVAPVKIGEGATVGAGSTISRNVGKNELVTTRAKLRTVKNWQRPKKTD
jgi:bifunctional UDP-N-acetylglucosamine pyrophosphorylase/glucosamine-1-phosphate N-acetyltransferase